MDQKIYYRHSGYPGGLRQIVLRRQMERHPERVIESAVRGMLPKNRLGRKMFKKLKVYAGPTHPHQAQQPKAMQLA
jgi:large subunit ribosomal protein L13